MADINALITLGIGTPGDILHFLLLGLNIGSAPVAVGGDNAPSTLDTPELGGNAPGTMVLGSGGLS